MRALLWKDCRVNSLVLVVGAILLLVPYVIAILWGLRNATPSATQAPRVWAEILVRASLVSLMLSQLTLALLGGNAIASERADRSAEFLAYLPPSRAKIVASKAILALGTMAVIWGLNLLVLRFLPSGILADKSPSATILSNVSVTGLVFFGVAWLGSSFLESPTFAACAGLVAPLVVVLSFTSSGAVFGWPPGEQIGDWYLRTCLVIGPLCFVAGICYYLRRVEP